MGTRILEIGPYPPPGTGWSIRIKMLKTYLERSGHVCRVLNTNKNRRTNSSEFIAIHNGFDYLWKVFSNCAHGYLVHMHINGKSTKSPALAIIAEVISLLFFRPAVLTFHAGTVQDYFPKQNKFWLDNIFRLIFLMAGKIVCNNNAVKERIVDYGIRADKIFPIPAFCLEYLEDISNLPQDLSDFIGEHEPIVCSYIYLRPDFNIDFFLQALNQATKQQPRMGIVLMGADREATVLQEKLQRFGLCDRVFIAGDLEHGTFLAVLQACRVYIRTPIVDGVSSSVLEALLLGAEVVASENGSRPKGVITYNDGSVDSFLSALRKALNQKKKPLGQLNGKSNNIDMKKNIAQQIGVGDTLREEISLLCAAAR